MKLSELRIKHKLGDGAKYEPDPNCKKCLGVGEYYTHVLKRHTFCACLFLDPAFRDEAMGLLASAVRTLAAEGSKEKT